MDVETEAEMADPMGATGVADAANSMAATDAAEATDITAALTRTGATNSTDSDARVRRMDRVAILYAEISAATREFLRAVAESDRHRDWAEEGFGSCAEWLAWRIGVTRNTANERVRVARALEELPLISEAMGRGELSFSKVRALTRAATSDNEAELLELARHASAARLERMIRSWKELERWDEDEDRRERARHRSRTFSVFPDEDGMYVVKGRLPAEVGAVLMRAVEAASDALFRGATADDAKHEDAQDKPARVQRGSSRASEDTDPDPAQLRADAVGLISERALAAGLGVDAPVSGSRAERYQVMLHVQKRTLKTHEGGDRPTRSELEDGTPVSAETARRLTCDAAVVEVRHEWAEHRAATGDVDDDRDSSDGGDDDSVLPRPAKDSLAHDCSHGLGAVLDVGRKTRTVPPALRRALEVRDRGCRFPGCGLRFTDAHHIEHWADGGRTALDNLVLLCGRHHRRVHEDGWRICCDRDGQVLFFTPKGKALGEVPTSPKLEELPLPTNPSGNSSPRTPQPPGRPDSSRPVHPGHRLLHRNRSRGIAPDWRTGRPRWKRDFHIPPEVEAAAWEALDS